MKREPQQITEVWEVRKRLRQIPHKDFSDILPQLGGGNTREYIVFIRTEAAFCNPDHEYPYQGAEQTSLESEATPGAELLTTAPTGGAHKVTSKGHSFPARLHLLLLRRRSTLPPPLVARASGA
jgi:hypothetical protein